MMNVQDPHTLTFTVTLNPRVRQSGFWLCLMLLLTVLVSSGIAETQGPMVAIDGVVLGQGREQVERGLGRSVQSGSLGHDGIAWYRYGQGDTTVSFSAQDRCVRIKGTSLKLDGGRRLGVGDSRKEVLAVLGEPVMAASRKGREVLEFQPAKNVALRLVVEGGVVVQLSANRPK